MSRLFCLLMVVLILSCNKEVPCPPITIEVTVINQSTERAEFSLCFFGCDQPRGGSCPLNFYLNEGQTNIKEVSKDGMWVLSIAVSVDGQNFSERIEYDKFTETVEAGKITFYLKYNGGYYLEVL